MKNDIHAAADLRHHRRIADVAFDDPDEARFDGCGKVLPPTAHEVVQDHDLGNLFRDQLVRDVGADKPSPTRDEYTTIFQIQFFLLRSLPASG